MIAIAVDRSRRNSLNGVASLFRNDYRSILGFVAALAYELWLLLDESYTKTSVPGGLVRLVLFKWVVLIIHLVLLQQTAW